VGDGSSGHGADGEGNLFHERVFHSACPVTDPLPGNTLIRPPGIPASMISRPISNETSGTGDPDQRPTWRA